jgi:hypothetical protein
MLKNDELPEELHLTQILKKLQIFSSIHTEAILPIYWE